MSEQTQNAGRLYVLLIGVDCYLENELPDGGWYPCLGGCARDISHVEEFLRRKFGLTDEHILKLTATYTGYFPPPKQHNYKPTEPEEQWPTYENMVKKFQQVTEMAQPGDRVYIHYSGHGGRASTAYPDLKGTAGLDEALVPADIGNTEARYLRDVELAHLIKKMVDKDLIVTVVLDSCHSGGATRGDGGAVVRGIREIDTTIRPTDSLVASPQELAETWQGISAVGTRNVKTGSGWLLEPKGYTLMAACRASESAYEYTFDGRERNGALTYWLLDSLKQIGPGLSYKMLHDRILAKVHSQFEQQTPQLQGEGDRTVFGSDIVQPQLAALVLQVDEARDRALLNVGQVHAVRKGAQFVVYPPATKDFTDIGERLALLEIAELGSADSWAIIKKRLRQDPIEQGAQAVLLDPGSSRLRRTVRLTHIKDLPAAVRQEEALQAVQVAITESESGFIRIAAEEEPADFQVVVNDQSEYEIWDSAGVMLSNLRPPLTINDASSPQRIAQRLVHLAKYRNVQELDNRDPMSPLARKLIVELIGWQTDFDSANAPEPQPFDDPGRTPTVKDGEWTFLHIRNTLAPGKENGPSRILNITVLDLQPDWGICQIYPSGAGLFEPLDPEQEIVLPLKASLPNDYTEGKDIIKVFATTGTTNFRWLELPSLDQPSTRSMNDLTACAPANSLEELLASVATRLPETRNVEVAAYPSRGWITSQVEVSVRR